MMRVTFFYKNFGGMNAISQYVVALEQKLDEQYEEYLRLLHEYTAARERLAKQVSDGSFSLAQANFATPNRTRFGQDQYDGRMQATRVVRVEPSENEAFNFILTSPPSQGPAGQDKSDDGRASESQQEDSEEKLPKPHVQDPIRWFGILVPQALRSCQASFGEAIECAAAIAALDSKMKALEIEVRRNKKRLSKCQQGKA